MVLRIEYLLLLVLSLLILSILGINPTDNAPTVSDKGDKEIHFENFSLFELHEGSSGKKLFASETTKYTEYMDLKDVNLTDEEGQNIIAKKAIYKGDAIYMSEKVKLTRIDGLTFTAEDLTYDLKTKEMQTYSPFSLEFNGSIIIGTDLEYRVKEKEISANSIEATILFVSENK